MTTEKKLQIRTFIKLLWVCVFALLYAWGGMEMKWLRRFIAPIWLTSGMFLFSRDWRVFIQAPLLMISLSLGYGANSLWAKIFKRFIYGMANGYTAFAQIFTFKDKGFIWVFGLHLILVVSVCIIAGVFNPLHSARAEELVMGFIIGFLPMFMPKDKEQG